MIPYELIGKVTVGIVAILLTLGVVALLGVGLLAIWVRGWGYVSDKAWKGYDPAKGETPPLWRSRVAGVTAALSMLQFRKIPAVYREATERADDSK